MYTFDEEPGLGRSPHIQYVARIYYRVHIVIHYIIVYYIVLQCCYYLSLYRHIRRGARAQNGHRLNGYLAQLAPRLDLASSFRYIHNNYIYIYIYIYICICIYVYVCIYIYIHTWLYIHIQLCIYIYIYMFRMCLVCEGPKGVFPWRTRYP